MSKWRPQGWNRQKIAESMTVGDSGIEAGADAMLDAVRKALTFKLISADETVFLNKEGTERFTSDSSGRLGFIPDDPKEETRGGINWHEYSKAVREKYLGEVNKPHPATKIVESGYFCSKCGMQIPNDINHKFCPDPGGRGIFWIK